MATSNVCTYSNDDEESDYSFEYVTDSEYESEEEGVDQSGSKVQEKEVVTQTIKIPVEQQMVEDEEEIKSVVSNTNDDSPTNTLSKEQIEAMKPKLPHYVTDPEPCAFSDDPGQWIAWMETQVNNERERRMKKLMESNSFEATEVNGCNEDYHPIEVEGIDENILDDDLCHAEEETCIMHQDKEEKIVDILLEEDTSSNLKESITEEVDIEGTTRDKNAEVLDNSGDNGCQEDSEWECEEEEQEVGNLNSNKDLKENEELEVQITDTDTIMIDNAIKMEIAQDTSEVVDDNQEPEIQITEEEQLIDNTTDCMEFAPEITIDAPKEDICSEIDSSDAHASKTADTDISVSQIAYKKQVSCSAIPDPSILPNDMQKKIDFIRKKKASMGQLIGETQASAAKSSLNNLLDEETQRKIAFVRQKKLEASQQSPNSASHENLSVKNSFLRQMSTPEKPNRPQSFASDAGLDDMLTRIKALRSERKQMLQDMSAIRNAFGGNEPSVNDDGIGSGNNTPSSDMIGSFSMDTDENRSGSPSIPDVVLSRQNRRSIDSGIGSKSLCSIQDGSPTAELDHPATHNHPIIRKVSREKNNPEDIVCFICGENMGKLSKGPIMHMGLEDGDPVCPDALYLTDECKEKIRQIGQTKSFTFEAKYELLETLELESWDMDSDITSGDLIDRVDAFLIDVEAQKEKDKERFNAMRSGAIDDVFNEEFADLMNSSSISKSRSFERSCDKMEVDSSESHQLTRISDIPPPAPPPPPMSLSKSYPEEDTIISKHSLPSPKIEMSAVHNAIKSGIHNLKHADTCEKSEIPMGKVIYKKIAPRVFNSDVRTLVRDISKEDHRKRLKKVKTNDKSKPFIPDDVEIYFYGGANAPAGNAPLPPTSKLKYSSSCLKRANVLMENGVSPVYLAAQEGHLEVLKYLVKEGGDVEGCAQDGMTPAHAAAQMGHLTCLQWIVKEAEVDIDVKDNDDATPLHFASSRGHTTTVKWLLEAGARLTADRFGKTPIHDATENNQSDVLVLLLKHTKKESLRASSKDTNGDSFYLHTKPNSSSSSSRTNSDKVPVEDLNHAYEVIPDHKPETEVARGGVAPPPPPLPPPDLLTPALNRTHVRRHSGESMSSLSTLSSRDDDNQDCHVIKPSELSKGRKRKNIPVKEDIQAEEEEKVIAGATRVLPFLPPKFSQAKREGDSLIKPSEYLRSLSKPSSLAGSSIAGSSIAGSGISGGTIPDPMGSEESGIDSPDCSLPSSSCSPVQIPAAPAPHTSSSRSSSAAGLPAIPESGMPPPPPPPPPAPPIMGGPPPPPPPPPHPSLMATVSAPSTGNNGTKNVGEKEDKVAAPSSMAISMKELKSVQLKKTEKQGLDRTHSVPLPKLLPTKTADFGGTKGDLIAELKMSHTVGGVGKLKSEQAKAQEELEKEQYKKFLGQFTAENFLKKIPLNDPLGNEIPKWKREMMAKKAAEKAKADSLEERARMEEMKRQATIPAWKRQLIEKRGDDAKSIMKLKKEREKERKKKLICKL